MPDKSNSERLLELFFTRPRAKMNLRDIGRKIRIAPPTAAYIAERLVKDGYLRIEKTGNMRLISAKNEGEEFIVAKRKQDCNSRNGTNKEAIRK